MMDSLHRFEVFLAPDLILHLSDAVASVDAKAYYPFQPQAVFVQGLVICIPAL